MGTLRTGLPHALHDQSAPLQSPWVVALFAAGVVLVVAAWVWYEVREPRHGFRRRWPVRVGTATLTVVLVVSTCLVIVNDVAGYAPTLRALPGMLSHNGSIPLSKAEMKQIRRFRLGAPALRVDPRYAYVYLPPGYADRGNTERYPVVYLIHGSPGGPADWLESGNVESVMNAMIKAHEIKPAIVVMPDASGTWARDSECLNQVRGPQDATYLTSTVVHYVDTHYRTIRSRGGRLIGGMSSGGYCALNLGLEHLGEYSAILAFEPYGDPGANNVRRLLGGSFSLYRKVSPRLYIPRMRFSHRVVAFLDVGSSKGRAIARVLGLADKLRARGQVVDFRVETGQGHNWHEAAAGLPYALLFTDPGHGRSAAGNLDRSQARQVRRHLTHRRAHHVLAVARAHPTS
ncbi:MAG TPA: alpha/beta hydrolase-fold protein [Streptosporangiales bacterium]